MKKHLAIENEMDTTATNKPIVGLKTKGEDMTTPEEFEEYFAEHPDVRDDRRKHLDAIDEKPAPFLARFLPEGWRWEHNEEWYVKFKDKTTLLLLDVDHIDDWHGYGLLHPSEGGGFQRHTPGDPMPWAWRPHLAKGGEA